MLLKIFKTKVDVDFIDARTNKIFAKSKMPIEQLPKSFATSTTMHIGNEDWQVLSAIPMTFEEIKKTKRLQLVLSKVISVDTNDILYSIPTLSNDVINLAGIDCVTDPEITDNEKAFIHPDDWRQIEFVSKEHLKTISNEIQNINNIYLDQKKNNTMSGFKNLYVRTLPNPIVSTDLILNNLLLFLNVRNKKHLAFPEINNIVTNGFFYYLSDNCGIYGIYDKDEKIKLIGILISNKPSKDEISTLINYGHNYNLVIVDWIRTAIIDEKFLDQIS